MSSPESRNTSVTGAEVTKDGKVLIFLDTGEGGMGEYLSDYDALFPTPELHAALKAAGPEAELALAGLMGAAEKASEAASHIVEVGPLRARRVDILAEDTEPHTMRTAGRTDCDAVLVWRTDAAGNDSLLMTHFHPLVAGNHLEALRTQIPQGEGTVHTVCLTRDASSERVLALAAAVEVATGTRPTVIPAPEPDLSRYGTSEALRGAWYELVAERMQGENGIERRIYVPLPDQQLAYDETF